MDLLGREDIDGRRSSRHNHHTHGSHHDPAYMSGGLNPADDIGNSARDRGGLYRNSHHGGWDLHPAWYGGTVSSQWPDNIQNNLSSLRDAGSRRSYGRSYSARDAEREWYGYAPSDGFAGYYPGWYGTNGSNRFPYDGSGGGYWGGR